MQKVKARISYYRVEDVMELLGVAESTAYAIIRDLNRELKKMGYCTVAGRVSKKFFHERYYGDLEVPEDDGGG